MFLRTSLACASSHWLALTVAPAAGPEARHPWPTWPFIVPRGGRRGGAPWPLGGAHGSWGRLPAGLTAGRPGAQAGPAHGLQPYPDGVDDHRSDGARNVRRFYVRTYGCQMNEHDSERIAGFLAARGMEPADDAETADVVVVNTCCIRENADNRFYGNLGHLKALKARRPDMQIAVAGCLAQKDRERIQERAGHVDVVVGTHNVDRIPALLDAARSDGSARIEILDGPREDGPAGVGGPATRSDPQGGADGVALPPPVVRGGGRTAWVTIQTGCDNSCAFCIVPSVRGREASRPLDAIVGEVADLVSRGTVEVTLLGQNVNSYGRDITRRRPQFAELLRAVGAVPGIRRVRFTSPHPKDLREETIAAMAETPAVCEQLHLPLQSGSDRVLAAMRRGYTAERYLARLDAARHRIADLAVTTDVIVAFPGETEEEFARTLEVVAEASYDSAYTFLFSPRPGTRAAAMEDAFVPDEVAAERLQRLRSVVERSALEKHRARIGRAEEVLVEGPSRREPSLVTGRTRQGKLVHFSAASAASAGCAAGSFATVRISGAARHYLVGELVPARSASAVAG